MSTPQAYLDYASRATAGIDGRTDRHQAREEILNHLLDLHEDELNSGASEDEAIQRVLGRMGSVGDIARPIEDAHTPRWRPRVVITILAIGVAVYFAIWLAFYLAMPTIP